MKALISAFGLLASLVCAVSTSAPAAACTTPAIAYSTLPKLFTINVLAGKDSFNVYLLPGHVDSNTYNKPLITSGTVKPLHFNLTKGILYQSGFPANARYVPPPPHPTTDQEMLFGGNPTIPPNESGFYASYACDANKKPILVLHQQQGFNVGSKDVGAELYITPTGYAGSTTSDFIPVKVKINGGL